MVVQLYLIYSFLFSVGRGQNSKVKIFLSKFRREVKYYSTPKNTPLSTVQLFKNAANPGRYKLYFLKLKNKQYYQQIQDKKANYWATPDSEYKKI